MNTSIKGKLIFGISLILILLFSTLFYVLYQLNFSNENLTRIVDKAAERIVLSNDVMHEVMEITRNEKNIIIETDHAEIVNYESRIDQRRNRIEQQLYNLEQLSGEDGKELIRDFRSAWAQYNVIFNQILALKEKDNFEAAFQLSTTEAKTSRNSVIRVLDRIIEVNKQEMLADRADSENAFNSSILITGFLTVLALLFTILLTFWIVKSITSRISQLSITAKKIASRQLEGISILDNSNDELQPVSNSLSDILASFREVASTAHKIAEGDYAVRITPKSEDDFLGNALNEMSETLEETTADNKMHNWLTSGQNLLNQKLRGEQNVTALTENTIAFISEYTGANVGALYLNQDNNTLLLSGSYAFSRSEIAKDKYAPGEGLPGQVAVDKKILHLKNLSEENARISSTIVNAKPKELIVAPFLKDENLLGVIELGKLKSFTEVEIDFIKNSMQIIGIAIFSAISRQKIQDLLEETQRQSEELQVQQEELRQSNEELEEQTQNLKHQQEELQAANEELEEQTQSVELKNRELEYAKTEIEKKNEEVQLSSRYKSQFLANMSHELRTPLNSLLILSKDLSDNKKGNLDESQVESAQIVYKSGTDLLQLINEVLDLSKIEAEKMNLNIVDISNDDIIGNINRNFKHVSAEKGIALLINKDSQLPEFIKTDAQRIDQIIKNLLSNAFKFTEQGSVSVSFQKQENEKLRIEVKDTGIGISSEKQLAVFEAFQQADGSTSRKYGGTGLGLSISRELAKLLGGDISLSSKVDEGSVFTLTIPLSISLEKTERQEEYRLSKPPVTIINKQKEFINHPGISDDRDSTAVNDKTILIIEDDLKFAGILMSQARSKGFKALVASSGEDGLILAARYLPKAIILDLSLPGINGLGVLSELKDNPSLRHIPVHILSAMERTLDPIKAGAVEYLMKPVDKDELEEAFLRMESFIDRKMKNLLIVEDDENSRKAIKILIGNGDVKCFEAGSGKEALQVLDEQKIDCIVLDLGLPDISGFDLIQKIQEQKKTKVPPIIIYTGKELTREENDLLQNFAETIIIKGVKSEERLLDETALFLHRTVNNLPADKKDIINDLHNSEMVFLNKKVLIVDDDMRNIFALSKVLKEHGMEIIKAENGIKALEAVDANPDISIVLMDIMMPEMDGLEATRKLKANEKYRDLPVIAITAKAMKEDRLKCLEAGADDYISKPIELERLFSLMKIWIKK